VLTLDSLDPGSASLLQAKEVAAGSVVLSWSLISQNASVVNSYRIDQMDSSGANTSYTTNTPSSSSLFAVRALFTLVSQNTSNWSFSLNSLSSNLTYTWTVTAVLDNGVYSSPSDSVSVTSPGYPAPPTDVQIDANTALVTWSPPDRLGGSALQGYQLTMQVSNGSYVSVLLPANTTSFVIPSDAYNTTAATSEVSVKAVTLFSSSPRAYASTASASSTTNVTSNSSSSLSGGGIAAIVVVLLLCLICGVGWWYWRKRHRGGRIHQDKLAMLQSYAEKETYRGQYVADRNRLYNPSPGPTTPLQSSPASMSATTHGRNDRQGNLNRVRLDPILGSP